MLLKAVARGDKAWNWAETMKIKDGGCHMFPTESIDQILEGRIEDTEVAKHGHAKEMWVNGLLS